MIHYQGPDAKDITFGNHGYLQENDFGHECYNFRPYRGKCYAYVHVTEGKSINIDRLGAAPEDEYIEGVNVVMFARNPSDDLAYIVGWYRNAKLYRYPQKFSDHRRTVLSDVWFYNAVCSEEDATLVDLNARTFVLESSRTKTGGFGQSAIWYADKQPAIVKKVLKYIAGEPYKTPHKKVPGKRSGGYNQDIETRLKIEKTSVLVTTSYFEKLGYSVLSVEKEACGWDLTAVKNDSELFIEVKGTQGDSPAFELTPNEYTNLKRYRKKYRISVVTQCLTQKPVLEIFSLIITRQGIIEGFSESGTIIRLKEKVGALCQLKK